MRISDWSSDVCSSDLVCREGGLLSGAPIQHIRDLRKTESEVAQQEDALQPDEGVLVVVAVSVVRDARRGKQADIAVVPQRPARRTGELRDLLNRPLHVRASPRSEEHTSELQSLMRISYAVFCLKKKKQK